MTYTYVFGGATVYPAEISYAELTLTTDVALSWPEETSASSNLAAKIMDVTASTTGLKVILPDAAKAGVGETILFNNIGSNTITVVDYDDVQVVTIAAGELWQIYLTDNSTSAGSWRSLQYGASISQANASSLAGTGIVAVGTLLSQSVPVSEFNNDYTSYTTDRAKMFNWTGSSGVFTLPSAQVVGNNWFVYLRNSGSGQIVATPVGINTIDSSSTLAFQPNESAIIASDGTNFYTIGFGQSATFAFDYTVINVAGTGNYTLTGTELNRIAYNFTGALTGDRLIVVPDTVQQYWVTNSTTGAFDLSIGTLTGSFQTIAQNSRQILYCDGVDVVDADTASVSFPILVSQGGTGATTASGARINLGASSVGNALFVATNQAAAWSALGLAQSGNIDGGTF